MRRYALVAGLGITERAVSAYLPANYRFEGLAVETLASHRGGDPTFRPLDDGYGLKNADRIVAVVSGVDDAGWTLDGYVIPRLRSGNYGACEIDLSHPAMKAIPA